MSLNEEFNPHNQDLPAQSPPAAQGVRPRTYTTWGFTSIGVGLAIAVAMYTHLVGGNSISPDVSQGLNTLTLVAIICGLMAVLAGKVMSHQDAARRDVLAGITAASRDRVAAEASLRAKLDDQALAVESVRALMVEQYTALARLVAGLEHRVEEAGERAMIAATRIATQHLGQLTHRIEQTEAALEQERKRAHEEMERAKKELASRLYRAEKSAAFSEGIANSVAKSVEAMRANVRELADRQETLAAHVAGGSAARVVLDISSEDAYELGKRVGEGERGKDQTP